MFTVFWCNRPASDPKSVYVMRLVGLPNEEVVIADGELRIDGVVIEKPAELAGLRYATEIPDVTRPLWGVGDNPAQLGEDEFFVLGDFSVMSNDSRLWSVPAEGHPAFAAPRSHVQGVVTHIYWPPQRLRTLR